MLPPSTNTPAHFLKTLLVINKRKILSVCVTRETGEGMKYVARRDVIARHGRTEGEGAGSVWVGGTGGGGMFGEAVARTYCALMG